MSGTPLKKMEEASYFFKLSAYQQRIIDHIEAHPEFIVPEVRVRRAAFSTKRGAQSTKRNARRTREERAE